MINDEFKRFTEKMEQLYKITFDMPFNDLAFTGAPFKSIVTILPNLKYMASLIEFLFFIVSLSDIELVHFERVSLGIKNFDIVIVYKDYSKVRNRITSIPMKWLETIKSWLDKVDFLFSEGVIILKWQNILDHQKNS